MNRFAEELHHKFNNNGVNIAYCNNNNHMYLLLLTEIDDISEDLSSFLKDNGYSYTIMKKLNRNIDMDCHTIYLRNRDYFNYPFINRNIPLSKEETERE